MKFKTTYSIYETIKDEDGMLHTTKLEALSESNFNAIGQTRINRRSDVPTIGERCYFDGPTWNDSWSTSIVTEILEED